MKKHQPILYVTLTLTDTKTGHVIKKPRRFKSRSYVKQMIQVLYVQMAYLNETVKDTAGANQVCAPSATNFMLTFLVGWMNSGIRVGTGITAVAITDFKLQTPILHGTAAGQLSHAAGALTAPNTSATTTSFTVTRTFANNSPGSITVNECGLYIGGGTGVYLCAIRDIIAGGIVVPVGQTLTITYTIGVTV